MGNQILLLFCSDKMAAVALCEIARVSYPCSFPGLEVIKLEFIPRLIIKRNDWLLADTCP